MEEKSQTPDILLIAKGKRWGTLRLIEGRLLLECKRQSRVVSFDLLASVQHGRAVTDEITPKRNRIDSNPSG